MAYTYGLEKIEIADLAGDGGPGTTFAVIGYTNPGTTKITTEQAAAVEKRCEEVSSPLVSIPGDETVSVDFQLIVEDVNTLPKVLGGSVVTGVWSAPDSKPIIEKTLKLTPKEGLVLTFNRVSIVGALNATLSKDGDLFYVDVKATVLQPTKSGTKRISATAK